MIKWLCTLPFLKEIYRQGGIDSFHLAHKDIRETMRDDLDKQAEILAKKKLEDLLSVVDERKIITFNEREKSVYIGGLRATAEQLTNLKQEAEAITQFDLWNVLNESPKKLAQNAMFIDDGVLPNQLLKGRAILYTLDTQNRILTILKSYSPK